MRTASPSTSARLAPEGGRSWSTAAACVWPGLRLVGAGAKVAKGLRRGARGRGASCSTMGRASRRQSCGTRGCATPSPTPAARGSRCPGAFGSATPTTAPVRRGEPLHGRGAARCCRGDSVPLPTHCLHPLPHPLPHRAFGRRGTVRAPVRASVRAPFRLEHRLGHRLGHRAPTAHFIVHQSCTYRAPAARAVWAPGWAPGHLGSRGCR